MRKQHPFNILNSRLAYIAGLFDGEGSAGVYVVNHNRTNRSSKVRETYKHFLPVAQLKMTDKDPVMFMKECFGGWYGTSKPAKPINRGPIHEWKVSHRKALMFAQTILPWCINESKRKQLQGILDHYKSWKPTKPGELRHGGPIKHDPH